MPSSKSVAPVAMKSLLTILVVYGSCLCLASATRVSVYMSEAKEVLNHQWDGSAENLALQLEMQGFEVSRAIKGQPEFSSEVEAPKAYVIPWQNGPVLYSSAENMADVTSFLSAGGLVIILDSNNQQGEALRQFVPQALGYEGDWLSCKLTGSNEAGDIGQLSLSSAAEDFLAPTSDAWPTALESVHTINIYSACSHEDSSATSTPLYNVNGDKSQVVAQAFGKYGVPGAIIWLGYSWQDGSQPMWGSLLAKLVRDFANGAYTAPEAEDFVGDDSESQQDLDNVLEVATDVAADTANIVRRFLDTAVGTYPPPINPAVPFVDEPPSPKGGPLTPTFRAPPPPKRGKQPPPPGPLALITYFQNILPMGVPSKTRDLVWYDDSSFGRELKDLSTVQLIYRDKAPCTARCDNCNRAWRAMDDSTSLPLFFKDPVQITSITIRQVKNPNIIIIQLLNWRGKPDGSYTSQDIGPTVFNSTAAPLPPCASDQQFNILPRDSGINQAIPAGVTQTTLPANLKVYQGVLLTISRPLGAKPGYGPFVEYVKFSGRALYANDPTEYRE